MGELLKQPTGLNCVIGCFALLHKRVIIAINYCTVLNLYL